RNLTADRLSKLSSQLLDAENDRKTVEANYEAAKAATEPSTVPSVRESDEIAGLRKAIYELRRKRAALVQIYTPEWAEVKKIDSEISQLQEDMAKASRESIESLKSKLDAAAAREAMLRLAYYKERGDANGQTQDEIAVADLNQRIETNRE